MKGFLLKCTLELPNIRTFCTFSSLPLPHSAVCHLSLSRHVTFSRRPRFPIMESWRHDDPVIHFEEEEGINPRVMSHREGFQEIHINGYDKT